MWELKLKTKIPVYSWAPEEKLDSLTLDQVKNLANLPFAHHHIALMADAHVGYGMPIGGVLASKDYIVPNAVGVDIGCGMVAVQTNLKRDELGPLRHTIGRDITEAIPVGFRKHDEAQEDEFFNEFPDLPIVVQEVMNMKKQIGTLGGGNHFIDIHYDETGTVWVVVHSGSRNLGKKVADHYHKIAKQFTDQNFKDYPSIDLSSLPADNKEGKEYIASMQFAQNFALNNRQKMLDTIKDILNHHFPHVEFFREINIHHNYASKETHFGDEVWVHRKGATSAKKDEYGIIPGSMATHTYITKGLGNPISFNTAAHGAGRALGRREAKRRFSIQQVKTYAKENDIELFAANNAGAIEEFYPAYKDIEDVMKLQNDLVGIEATLTPVLVVIG